MTHRCWKFTPDDDGEGFLELLPAQVETAVIAKRMILRRWPELRDVGGQCTLVPQYWVMDAIFEGGNRRQVLWEPQPGEPRQVAIARARRHIGAPIVDAVLVGEGSNG